VGERDWDLGEKVGERGMGERGEKDSMKVREGSRERCSSGMWVAGSCELTLWRV
jgi:hypothetical protein